MGQYSSHMYTRLEVRSSCATTILAEVLHTLLPCWAVRRLWPTRWSQMPCQPKQPTPAQQPQLRRWPDGKSYNTQETHARAHGRNTHGKGLNA
eukprot:1637530-Amphidinium_carterae.1